MLSPISKVYGRLAPPPGGALRALLVRIGRRIPFWVGLLLVCWFYKFIVEAGTAEPPLYGVYHDLLADGFLSGHLSIPLAPAPELLRAKDPYDYANINYWSLDASYYKGKYYIYWGPVPALCLALFKASFRIHRALGDHYLALFFHCVGFWAGAVLIDRLLLRVFGSTSRYLRVLGIAVFAFANPTPHSVATASTYQTAIMAAQAWLMAGLLVAFDAVWHAGTANARWWRVPLAGVLWALALGSRLSTAPAVASLVLLTAAGEAWPGAHRWRRALTNTLELGLPLAVTGAALLTYNKLRFDDWLEFGSNNQLSGFPRLRLSSVYLLANLYSYTFRGFAPACSFPYVYQEWNPGRSAFPAGFPLKHDYMVIEPVVGWAVAAPIAWLFPLAFVFAWGRRQLSRPRDRAYLFCLFSFASLATLSGVAALGIYAATMRYLGDITFGLVLLSLLAGYALRFHRFGLAAPRAVSALLGVLGTVTVVIGLLLGYQGYNAHFHRYNPSLDAKLVQALSFCGERIPPPPSWMR